MDKKEIKSVWAAFQQVKEQQAMKKESEESPYPTLDKKKREKKGSNLEPAGGPADKLKGAISEDEVPPELKKNAKKMKKGTLPGQKNDEDGAKDDDHSSVKEWSGKEGNRRVSGGDKRKLKEDETDTPYPTPKKVKKAGDELEDVKNRTAKLKEEEGPYPAPKKVKKAGDALEPVNNRTAKLKEGDKEECPKCQGEGCDHCDGTGYHVKAESVQLDTSLFTEEELARIQEKTAGEPFMSTASEGEKKFFDDHKKSDPKLENPGDHENSDKAGKAVKSQAPNRGADNLSNGDSKSPGK